MVQLCDLLAPLFLNFTHEYEKRKCIRLHIKNSKHLWFSLKLFNNTFNFNSCIIK